MGQGAKTLQHHPRLECKGSGCAPVAAEASLREEAVLLGLQSRRLRVDSIARAEGHIAANGPKTEQRFQKQTRHTQPETKGSKTHNRKKRCVYISSDGHCFFPSPSTGGVDLKRSSSEKMQKTSPRLFFLAHPFPFANKKKRLEKKQEKKTNKQINKITNRTRKKKQTNKQTNF